MESIRAGAAYVSYGDMEYRRGEPRAEKAVESTGTRRNMRDVGRLMNNKVSKHCLKGHADRKSRLGR